MQEPPIRGHHLRHASESDGICIIGTTRSVRTSPADSSSGGTYAIPHAIPARRRKPAAMRSSSARSAWCWAASRARSRGMRTGRRRGGRSPPCSYDRRAPAAEEGGHPPALASKPAAALAAPKGGDGRYRNAGDEGGVATIGGGARVDAGVAHWRPADTAPARLGRATNRHHASGDWFCGPGESI